MKPLTPTEQKRLNREWRHRTENRIALLLDSVQTPYNVGSIMRVAASFRVEHLYLAGATAPPTHPGARKTSLGTERLVDWSEFERVEEAAEVARTDGFRVVGIELAGGARPLADLSLTTPVCLALGHEDRGLSPACLRVCDELGYVPTPGRVGSLNVATAAGIALYEARRQEWATPSAT